MSPLHRLARRASRRITVARFIRALGVALPVCLTLGALAVLVDRLIGPGYPWWWAAASGAGLAILISIALAWRARADALSAASHVDNALRLKDRLGSAIALERTSKDDPFASIAIAEATELAKRVSVHHAIPVGPDRTWWWWPVTAAVLIAVGIFVPQMRLLENVAEQTAAIEKIEAKEKATTALDTAAKKIEEAEDLGAPEDGDFALADELKALAELKDQLQNGLKDPQEAAAEAASAIDQKAQELEQKSSEQQAADDAAQSLTDAAAQELAPEPGAEEVDKIIEEMRKGDMEAAAKAVEELEKKMEGMSEADREKAAQRLEQMASAMEQAAQQAQQNAANQAHQSAQDMANRGMSPQDANQLSQKANSGASQSDLEKQLRDQGMTAEQARETAKKLSESAQQQRASQSACKNASQCSGSMRDAAQSLRQCKGGSPSNGKNGKNPGGQNSAGEPGQQGDPSSQPGDGKGTKPGNGTPVAAGGKGQFADPNGPPSNGAGRGSALHNLKQQLTGAATRTKQSRAAAQQAQQLRVTKDDLLRDLAEKNRKQQWIEQEAAEGRFDKNWKHNQTDMDMRQGTDDGQVIAQNYVPGDGPAPFNPDAVSHRVLTSELSTAMESAERAIEDRVIPPRYQKNIQRYFQKTIKRAKAAEPAPPTGPAPDATDVPANKPAEKPAEKPTDKPAEK